MKKIEFNNGFVTAIALFLEHKNNWQKLTIEKPNKKGIMKSELLSDLRLYGATDHLYGMEIPELDGFGMCENFRKRIIRWRNNCFKYRLGDMNNPKMTKEEYSEIQDILFKEAEDILARIDKQIFQTKKVIMRYR